MPWSIKPPWLAGLQKRVMDGTMADSQAVQTATELIEQRLAQEEENEVQAEVWVPRGVLRRSDSVVKGRKRLAPSPVVGGQMSPGLYSSRRVLLVQSCWQWETESQELRDSGLGVPSWVPQDPSHPPGP